MRSPDPSTLPVGCQRYELYREIARKGIDVDKLFDFRMGTHPHYVEVPSPAINQAILNFCSIHQAHRRQEFIHVLVKLHCSHNYASALIYASCWALFGVQVPALRSVVNWAPLP